MSKLKILFLCTGNSCRSQMAEAWARRLKADVIDPYSAGIEKHGMNPHAVKVMAEAGVDMSKHYSKTTAEIGSVQFDYVVTVCGHANESCPVFPGKTRVVHVGFEDPPKLTKDMPDGEEKLAVYRRVRDEIRKLVEGLPEALKSEARNPKSEGSPKTEIQGPKAVKG
jgi:arsenate reductase (thioredoxin)